ncbi:MAG: hypothetical protein AAF206_30460 [Bacteroidota bacterium]
MKKSKTPTVALKDPRSLTDQQIDQMCALYLAHHHTNRQACEERIRTGFDQIILYQDPQTKDVVGYNGVQKRIHRIKGFLRPVLAVYLGQLYIDKAFRGGHPVPRAMIRIFLREKLMRPWLMPFIWADALTYKPYMLMAMNSKHFYPNPDRETPEAYQNLITHLGQDRYGDRFDPTTGCVSKDSKLLKDHVAPIPERLLRNKFIRFYRERNVNFESGGGLLVVNFFDWYTVRKVFKKLITGYWHQFQKNRRKKRTVKLENAIV